MKCTRNPKIRQQVRTYHESCAAANGAYINFSHFCAVLIALNKVRPKQFYMKNLQRCMACIQDNIAWANADGDEDVREYRIKSMVEEVPEIDRFSWKLIQGFKAAADLKNKALRLWYSGEDAREVWRQNLIIVLYTLETEFGLHGRYLDKICKAVDFFDPDPISKVAEWDINCEKTFDEARANASEVLKAIEERHKADALANAATPQEQQQAAEEIQAFRRYLESVTKENNDGNKG